VVAHVGVGVGEKRQQLVREKHAEVLAGPIITMQTASCFSI
jgi:hypothetical protein